MNTCTSPEEKPTILIVDDQPENLHILMETLGDSYRLIPAKDGESALRKAQKQDVLDLVLLDIMMPGIDGYEVLRRLKNNPALAGVPVIFITAVSEAMDKAKGFHYGAVDFVTKPFVPEVVRARVATHVELKRKTDLLEKLATTDALTGVHNRRKIGEMLEAEFHRAMRNEAPLSLAFLDIDHFKRFNDRYGHTKGDECLQGVCCAILSCLKRPSDAVGRYGGEEFLIMLPGTEVEGATQMAAAMVRDVAALDIKHEDSPTAPRVTVSVGVVTMFPRQGGPDMAALLNGADKMLYEAKAGGRNRISVSLLQDDGSLVKP